MNITNKEFQKIIDSLNTKTDLSLICNKLHGIKIQELDYLVEQLKQDHEFEKIELLESLLKIILKPFLTNPISGKVAREIAKLQQKLGFIMKYKTYAVKATTILGYSVFLQNEGEGFSFQRHITHKTEVFHILNKKPNGFVFICDYESWKKHYNRDTFNDWMRGITTNDFFESHRYEPEPGDVIIIDKLGTVHTVVGCDLIEYATVSTDMVERLHDQNKDKNVPSKFNRIFAETAIRNIVMPTQNRIVDLSSKNHTKEKLVNNAILGGQKIVLQDKFLGASIYFFDPKSESDLFIHNEYSKLIHIVSGTGTVFIGEKDEISQMGKMSMQVFCGDTILVPCKIFSKFINNELSPLVIAEQAINSSTALI